MKIIYHASFTESRAKDFFRFHLFTKNNSKFLYYGFSLLCILLSIVLFVTKQNIVIASLVLFASILIFGVRPVQINHIIKKTLKNQDFVGKKYSLKILDSKIEYYNHDDFLVNYKWTDILYVYELRNYWYFYISQHGAIIIVKELVDYENRLELKAFIEKNFVPKKLFKKYNK